MLGILVSCTGNKTPEDSEKESVSNDVVEDNSETETETTRKEIEIENFAQGGVARDYTMYVRGSRYKYLWVEKDSTDKVESGAYKRNQIVQDKFGVKIKIKACNGDTKTDDWVTALSVAQGYDLAVPDYWWLLEQQGLFLNLYAREELAFNQDYWYSNWNDNVTINNKLYTVAGDASLEVLENIGIVFFNVDMLNTVQVDMYDLVDSKKWTMAEMIKIGKNFTDPNAATPTYGAEYDVHSLRSQLFAADLKLTKIENGTIELIASSRTKNINIQEAVEALIHDETTYYWGGGSTARNKMQEKAKMLSDKRVAFYVSCMYVGSYVKDTGVNYGVVPMPMYEEGGEYISTSYGVSTFAIPKTAADYHFSSVILDALNYYSYNTVVTNFYDTAMKAQIADSADDARMMDIARDSLYFDFAWMLDEGKTMTVFSAFQKATNDENIKIGSLLDKAMETSIEGLQSIIAFYNQD